MKEEAVSMIGRAKFFLGPQIKNQEESAGNSGYFSDSQNKDLEQDDVYSRSIARAYHLHMSGKNIEQSFIENRDLGHSASEIGDLDLAERCYNRALNDARQMKRPDDEMACLFSLTSDVYTTWGRIDEALVRYQTLQEYFTKTANTLMLSVCLNNMGLIHRNKGEYDRGNKDGTIRV